MNVRVAMVDDDATLGGLLQSLLAAQPGIEIVWSATDGPTAIAKCAAAAPAEQVDVVLMDVQMPGMDGIAATAQICAQPEHPMVIMLTTFSAPQTIRAAMAAGAKGYLVKDDDPAEIAKYLHRVTSGPSVYSPTAAQTLTDVLLSPDTAAAADTGTAVDLEAERAATIQRTGLSKSELRVLELLAEAQSNREIALNLNLAEATVKSHVSAILTKLGVRDRAGAITFAFKHELF